jgi:nucleoside-diphosphate-sugar epimerase
MLQQHYLVTGAGGFIGTALCRRLQARGHRVRALLRRPAEGPWEEVVCADLADAELPAGLMEGIDRVFHLAAIVHAQDAAGIPDEVYQQVNVGGTRALLDAAVAADVRGFVHFSSVKAVADPGERCVDETWDAWPDDAYGRSKREAEEAVLHAGRDHGIHVCNLRPCLVYGPGVKGNLARMIDAIERGRFPPLPDFGNRRSLVGLEALIDAAWLAMEMPAAAGHTFIVADAEPYSTRQIADAIRRGLGMPAPRLLLPSWSLAAGAALGDLVQRVTGLRMPLNGAVLRRIAGSACYRSDLLQRTLGWESRSRFERSLPGILAARAPGGGAARRSQ